MHRFSIVLVALVLFGTHWAGSLEAQQADKEPKNPGYSFQEDHDPYGTGKFYMDREIARVMGHQGWRWLERKSREEEEEPSKLLKALKIEPGMAIADIGAGSGYFAFRMSEMVGKKGKVYAVDIQKEMLALIRAKMKARQVNNIVTVQGKIDDPKLPAKAIDLILMVDVYHEFSHPFEMTRKMLKSLKKGGRLVFVEYRKEDPKVPILLVHKMFRKQVIKEMAIHPEAKYVKTIGILPRQHIIIFEKK
ncbi:MAG: class I SAM-dependent methyltransferase [Gemmataceae bacterium]